MSTPATGLVTFWVTVINLDSWTRKYRDYVMPAYHRRTYHGSALSVSEVYEVVRYVYGLEARGTLSAFVAAKS